MLKLLAIPGRRLVAGSWSGGTTITSTQQWVVVESGTKRRNHALACNLILCKHCKLWALTEEVVGAKAVAAGSSDGPLFLVGHLTDGQEILVIQEIKGRNAIMFHLTDR